MSKIRVSEPEIFSNQEIALLRRTTERHTMPTDIVGGEGHWLPLNRTVTPHYWDSIGWALHIDEIQEYIIAAGISLLDITYVDVIGEYTGAAGTSFLNTVQVDTINEYTADNGVFIEGAHLENNVIAVGGDNDGGGPTWNAEHGIHAEWYGDVGLGGHYVAVYGKYRRSGNFGDSFFDGTAGRFESTFIPNLGSYGGDIRGIEVSAQAAGNGELGTPASGRHLRGIDATASLVSGEVYGNAYGAYIELALDGGILQDDDGMGNGYGVYITLTDDGVQSTVDGSTYGLYIDGNAGATPMDYGIYATGATSNYINNLTMGGNIIMPDGGWIGQAAGPLITFDDTSNYLEITGCNVGIGTTTPVTTLEIYNPNESVTHTDFTQALTKAGIHIVTDFLDASYTPGIFWSTQDNNPTKPKAGIYTKTSLTDGTHLYLGVSNAYATGITDWVIINDDGNILLQNSASVKAGTAATNLVELYNAVTGNVNLQCGYNGGDIVFSTSLGAHDAYNQEFVMTAEGVMQAGDFAKTGWPLTPGVTLSFVNGTRTFTVTDGGAAYYYIDGVKYTLGGNKTVVITDTEGLWYIYFVGSTLTASQVQWNWQAEDFCPVAYLYWDNTNNEQIFVGYEPHWFNISGATHARLHFGGGAAWDTGLLVSDAGAEDVNVEAGAMFDEDLLINITDGAGAALFEQVLSPAELPIYYRLGATPWRIFDTADKANATDSGYVDGANDLKYNELAAGVYQLTTVGLNNYVAYYVVATNEQTEPVALIMGQSVDNKLTEAKVNNIFSGLDLTGLPFEEMVVLARLILKDTGAGVFYTLEHIADLRAFNAQGNVTSPLITSHAGLSQLAWSVSGHYFDAAVDFNAQNITNVGTLTTTGAIHLDADNTTLSIGDDATDLQLQSVAGDGYVTAAGSLYLQAVVDIVWLGAAAGNCAMNLIGRVAGNDRYVTWLVDDADDRLELTRSNVAVGSYWIDMPVEMTSTLTFTGATTVNHIKFPDNLADALSFENANGDVFQTFISTTNELAVQFPQRTVQIGSGALPDWDPTYTVLHFEDENAISSIGALFYFTQNAYFDDTNDRWEYITADEASLYFQAGGTHGWDVAVTGAAPNDPITWLQRLLIEGGGQVVVGGGASIGSSALTVREDTSNVAAFTMEHTAAGGDNPYGLRIDFANKAPNDATRYFLRCHDSAANRCYVMSNGGLHNFQANDVNLSDRSLKENIVPCGSEWDTLKQLSVVKYRYKDQEVDTPDNMGGVAQDIQAVCPDLVSVAVPADEKEGQEELLGIRSHQVMWKSVRVLQEAQEKIEVLEAEVAALRELVEKN